MSTRDNYHDALAWLYAIANRDFDARNQLAVMVDPTGMVDALVDMHLGLANIATRGRPLLYLDHMRDHLDELLDRYGLDDEEAS